VVGGVGAVIIIWEPAGLKAGGNQKETRWQVGVVQSAETGCGGGDI
jgi:hypothetical protein